MKQEYEKSLYANKQRKKDLESDCEFPNRQAGGCKSKSPSKAKDNSKCDSDNEVLLSKFQFARVFSVGDCAFCMLTDGYHDYDEYNPVEDVD